MNTILKNTILINDIKEVSKNERERLYKIELEKIQRIIKSNYEFDKTEIIKVDGLTSDSNYRIETNAIMIYIDFKISGSTWFDASNRYYHIPMIIFFLSYEKSINAIKLGLKEANCDLDGADRCENYFHVLYNKEQKHKKLLADIYSGFNEDILEKYIKSYLDIFNKELSNKFLKQKGVLIDQKNN